MTTPTNNPVPSSSPLDLLFNAETMDVVVNSGSLHYTDRFGFQRTTVAGAVASIAAINVRGAWATATSYSPRDVVSNSGTWYIAVTNHTSGATFDGDLAANWRIYQGVTSPDLASELAKYGFPVALAAYGTLANDGATNDIAIFQAAAASGARIIDARGVNCVVDGIVNIGNNQVWLLGGASLKFTGSNKTIFSAVAKHDFALIGPFTITGDGSTVGTSKAIYIEDCTDWYVDRPILKSVRGWGIYLAPGSSTSARSRHGTINQPRIDLCYVGYEDTPGTGSEYCIINGIHATRCTLVGVKTSAGNMLFSGGQIVDNADNVHLVGGANHGHGQFVGVNINHATSRNLYASGVVNGQDFVGCHFYDGLIHLDGCKGIVFNGGHLDANIQNDSGAGSGLNIARDMFCPGGGGAIILTGTSTRDFVFLNNTGPGALTSGGTRNDAGIAFVQLRRAAGSTMAIASASTTQLTFGALLDRRGLFSSSALVTVPYTGFYHLSGSLLFKAASGLTSGSCHVHVMIDGVATRLLNPVFYGSTKCSVNISESILLTAGQVISINAFMTGTSIEFGDSACESTFAVRLMNG